MSIILISHRNRGTTWRKLWLWLAEGEKELGITISDKAIEQMRERLVVTDEDLVVAAVEEKKRSRIYTAMISIFIRSRALRESLGNHPRRARFLRLLNIL